MSRQPRLCRKRIVFRNFDGLVGKTDLSGTIAVDPRGPDNKPLVEATLRSRSVDLNDLAGFIGGTPGEKTTPHQTVSQKHEVVSAAKSDRLLPTSTLNVPKLNAADVHLSYRAGHVQGRFVPFDNLVVNLTIEKGDIELHPLNFAIGYGTLASNISIAQTAKTLKTKAKVDFERLDLARIMRSTHAFEGQGTVGGGATLDTEGNSISAMLGNGSGAMRLNMASGGNLSALLQDLAGLEVGNALLSAIGVPSKAKIKCMRSAFTLRDGLLTTDLLALDTTENVTRGSGTVNFKDEKIDYKLQTKPTGFSIGTLHTPIDITGTLKHPSIGPAIKPLAERGGVVAALAIVFPPLAVIPTIQLGVGQNTDCKALAGSAS